MSKDVHVIAPSTSLARAVRDMADRRIGSVIVVERGRVVGLLTVSDALSLLADLLDGAFRSRGEGPSPSEVRARIQREHHVLRGMLTDAEATARRVLAGEAGLASTLLGCARELYRTLLRHIDLEDAILAPELRDTDAYGPQRAQALLSGHRHQRDALRTALLGLDEVGDDARSLAREIEKLAIDVRADMAREDGELLDERLLRDELVATDHFIG
jgi:CBS domain-containing protein